MLTSISVDPGTRPGPTHGDRLGVLVVLAAPFEGDPVWDPVGFSWPVLGILLAITAVLTIGFLVWTALQPEEPDHDTTALVDKATREDREQAAAVRLHLDADTGRAGAGRFSAGQATAGQATAGQAGAEQPGAGRADVGPPSPANASSPAPPSSPRPARPARPEPR